MSTAQKLLDLDLLLSRNGTPFSGQLTKNRIHRRNTTSEAFVPRNILHPDTTDADRENQLWIVDLILESQTVAHFIEFTMCGNLPSGKHTSIPLLEEDAMLTLEPLSSWAPSPFDEPSIPMDGIMTCVGSEEDSSRLVPISKRVHAMKSRLWEGIMPLSERRWAELGLDKPENFHDACQYFCAVIDVFHYLNTTEVKKALRETYNRIWRHLKTFEDALNAKRLAESKPLAQVTGLWHEYIKDLFTHIANSSHHWVIDHINRLREPIIQHLTSHTPTGQNGQYDEVQWLLSNMIHDLVENAAQADSAIFIPTDGYRGDDLASQDDASCPDYSNPYREQPISFSANTLLRKADYYCRLKYMSRAESWTEDVPAEELVMANANTGKASADQARGQDKTRAELRGEPNLHPQPRWVREANRQRNMSESRFEWGYIGYRVCHTHSDQEWGAFKAKFEEDVSNWGQELSGVDEIRARSKVIWKDARQFGIKDGDVAAAKECFQSFRESDVFPAGLQTEIFLLADQVTIDSYLKPTPEQGGSVLTVDVDYDPEDPSNRVDESPGYKGSVRVFGSLLWDDLGAMLMMQTQHLTELWPLAVNNPMEVYEGPLSQRRTSS